MLLRLIAATLFLLAPPVAAQSLTVMSFNVRLPIDADGANRWEARRDIAAAALRQARPDVIGTQELHQRQGNDLIARMPGYAWFGIDRRGGHADEHMGVIYNRRTLRLERFGQFWLSDTPDVPGSISWGHPYPRMVTWAIFERIADHRRFRLLDTHLPYRAEDEGAREKGARMILDFVRTGVGADLPTILTGDFNTTPDSATHAILASALTDARDAVAKPVGPEQTFHNFTGTPDRRIDWILSARATARSFATLTDHRGPVYASDHFPVVATFTLP